MAISRSKIDDDDVYVNVMNRIKVENPLVYEKVIESYRGGMTGNECRMLISNALWDIKPEEVSKETYYKLIPKAIRALKI